jgi:hypothetical protein
MPLDTGSSGEGGSAGLADHIERALNGVLCHNAIIAKLPRNGGADRRTPVKEREMEFRLLMTAICPVVVGLMVWDQSRLRRMTRGKWALAGAMVAVLLWSVWQ